MAHPTVPCALLLTGKPGVGKTTLVREAAQRSGLKVGGFFTEEIRFQGLRRGFSLVTLDGHRAVLAHRTLQGPYRVGKYGVDTWALDRVGVPAVNRAIGACELILVDEVGEMELFSPRFQEVVVKALDSGKPLLGTIMGPSHPWADQLKRRPGVRVVTLTREGWHQTLEEAMAWLSSWRLRFQGQPQSSQQAR